MEKEIARFISKFDAADTDLVEAGIMLKGLLEKDPGICEKLVAKYPHRFTMGMLNRIIRAGITGSAQWIFANDKLGMKVSRMTETDQVKVTKQKIKVVVGFGDDGQPIVEDKFLIELADDPKMVSQIIEGKRIRNEKEQVVFLKKEAARKNRPAYVADEDGISFKRAKMSWKEIAGMIIIHADRLKPYVHIVPVSSVHLPSAAAA